MDGRGADGGKVARRKLRSDRGPQREKKTGKREKKNARVEVTRCSESKVPQVGELKIWSCLKSYQGRQDKGTAKMNG